MVKFGQERALATVEDVFNGQITWAHLDVASYTDLVYIGVGLMIAEPKTFFSQAKRGHFTLKYPLTTIFNSLFVEGRGATCKLEAYAVQQACLRLDFYVPAPKGQPTVLAPPAQLIALVRRYGVTQAVLKFHKDAEAAKRRQRDSLVAARAALANAENAQAVVTYLREHLPASIFNEVRRIMGEN